MSPAVFTPQTPLTMRDTVVRARREKVDIGAHPGFMDLWGFGRRSIPLDTPDDIEHLIAYQVGALQAISALQGARHSASL